MLRMCSPSHGHRFVSRIHDFLEDVQPGLTRKVVGGVAITAALSYIAVRGYRYYRNVQIGQERRKAARQALQDLKDYLNQQETANREKDAMIVGLSFTELRDKLQKGELTAVEVLRAFQRKALAVNDRLNCITEPIVEAEALAKELDKVKPEQRGPLHGIPISIKDCIFIKGYDCHAGFACLVGELAVKDADVIQELKRLGAVPFVRTNFPQGLISISCSNPIYGRTLNPYDSERGPGGSSGGEGALLAAGGSILGIGSDIGGSLRVPAHMCGVYALKPTAGRFLIRGHIALRKGQTAVQGTLGSMSRDMEGLIEMTRAIYTPMMHDINPAVPPCSFNDELFQRKGPLRIGFYTTIEGIPPHPACVRAVLEAKAALEQMGHKVVPFTPQGALHAFAVLEIKAVFAGDGKDSAQRLKDDTLDKCISTFYYPGKVPPPLNYLWAKLKALRDPLDSQMAVAMCQVPKTVSEWWNLQAEIMDYKQQFLAAWKSEKLDAVLSPVTPYPALFHGTEEVCFYSLAYTGMYNVLNYPAGAVPVAKVAKQDVQKLRDPSTYPRSGYFEEFVVKSFDGAMGLPVGVQVAALPFQEEMVLRVMKDIDTAFKK